MKADQLQQFSKDSDAAIQGAMDFASKNAPAGLAGELLKGAGLVYGNELYEVQDALQDRDPASPLHKLSKQHHVALRSQGRSMLGFLLNKAEEHLAEGRSASHITADWAMAQVKSMRQEVAAEKKRHAVPQPTAQEILATVKAERDAALAELEKAKQIIAILQGTN
jgi:hypothetical protein